MNVSTLRWPSNPFLRSAENVLVDQGGYTQSTIVFDTSGEQKLLSIICWIPSDDAGVLVHINVNILLRHDKTDGKSYKKNNIQVESAE